VTGKLTDVTDATFKADVLDAEGPVLDRIAAEGETELKLVEGNKDKEHELQQRYGVASIPTMILFKDGEPSASVIGAQPKGAIERWGGLAVWLSAGSVPTRGLTPWR
jgi:thioredoxin 1